MNYCNLLQKNSYNYFTQKMKDKYGENYDIILFQINMKKISINGTF